ncbi:MAG: acetate uptake transporter [Methanomicrobiales archaeon]|nr:acetate uptake transporter [Methanomicrobiales archaeon]
MSRQTAKGYQEKILLTENVDTGRNDIFLTDNTANPAPLGLCAFGMTTLLLSIHNLGLTTLSSPILAMTIFYGGVAQVIAGIMEWKKNNTFGLVTFGSFGFFWISFATILMLPALGLAKAPGPAEFAAFLSVWGIFALGLFVCTLKMHKILMITLLAVVLLVILLVAAQLTGNPQILQLGGAMGIIAGALALYIGIGQLVNEIHGKKVFPV